MLRAVEIPYEFYSNAVARLGYGFTSCRFPVPRRRRSSQFPATTSRRFRPYECLNSTCAKPIGALAFLVTAAFLEAFGDSFFQAGFYHASGWGRLSALVAGAVVLAAYGSVVNLPRWDFGTPDRRLCRGVLCDRADIEKVRFGHSPTLPIYAGGALIVAGGLVMAVWNV